MSSYEPVTLSRLSSWLYDWARRATEQGLARAVWEGLRACRLPPDLPPLGQIRFSSA
ncbi:MAG: hypothetical protein KJ072_23000 [Verrucomicrobia bacterium]|nr:hypothetical protein [Verrucomicrobiota bacterium]